VWATKARRRELGEKTGHPWCDGCVLIFSKIGLGLDPLLADDEDEDEDEDEGEGEGEGEGEERGTSHT
jgi:hypothetical protein